MRKLLLIVLPAFLLMYAAFTTGCGQVGMPTGGVKDTLAPVVAKAVPKVRSTNVTTNKITLHFDEYITLDNISQNLLISPVQKRNPEISGGLSTVTIRFRDTLKPNTTYTINFGNAIKDVNEGNVAKNFTYVFSTGNYIDSLTLKGRIILAENGKVDSTISAMLYSNLSDTAVLKTKPDYIARTDGDGNFTFENLPAGVFKLYALKDGDGGKTYNSKTEIFAFLPGDEPLKTTDANSDIVLYAYQSAKDNRSENNNSTLTAGGRGGKSATNKLSVKANYTGKIDLDSTLILSFSTQLSLVDNKKILVTDTSFRPVSNYSVVADTNKRDVLIQHQWLPEAQYKIIISADAVKDTANNSLAKADTISLTAKKTEDYGSVTLRFQNLDLAKKPVLLFVQNEVVKMGFPLTTTEWVRKLFPTGEYDLRVLYDTNGNGRWDAGDYEKKLQPEKTATMPQRLSVKANWDNERDVEL